MSAVSFLSTLALESAAALVAPARCSSCDADVRRRAAFCGACASTVDRDGPPEARGDVCSAAFIYGGAIARAIARLKYERRPDLGRPLGDLLAASLHEFDARGEGRPTLLVVPVPLHPARLAERGYNQSTLLATRVARALGARLVPLALKRVRETPPQATLGRTERQHNLAGAFVARDPAAVRGRRVLLVDDVRTTGATLGACTDALLGAGASYVSHAVVARASAAL